MFLCLPTGSNGLDAYVDLVSPKSVTHMAVVIEATKGNVCCSTHLLQNVSSSSLHSLASSSCNGTCVDCSCSELFTLVDVMGSMI